MTQPKLLSPPKPLAQPPRDYKHSRTFIERRSRLRKKISDVVELIKNTPRSRSTKISAKMVYDHLKGEKNRGFLPSIRNIRRLMTEVNMKGLKAQLKPAKWYQSPRDYY